MAVARPSFQRFDGKLDGILRKHFPLELYERLTITESCIVVTHGGKKSQRLVVLGHTAIYFAEVPPKTVKKAIGLDQVVSIKTVKDVPNFLPDGKKENVLHIQIFYMTSSSSLPLAEQSPQVANPDERSRSVSPRISHRHHMTTGARSTTPTATFRKQFTMMSSRIQMLQSEDRTSSMDSLGGSSLSLLPVGSSVDERTKGNHGNRTNDQRLVTLDLYVLQGKKGYSQFYHHLNVLLEDVSMCKMTGYFHPPDDKPQYQYQQESLTANFQSLKSELLLSPIISNGDYEKSASLLIELKQGADKYYLLKKLFWQDLELIDYCITQLTRTARIKNRHDQIEYCVIVADLLLTMFTESHPITDRTRLLVHNHGNTACVLVNSLIKPFNSFGSTKDNVEINKLCTELAGNVAGIIYEVLRLIQQITWLVPGETITAVTLSTLCDLISTQPTVVPFLSLVVKLVCNVEESESLLVQYRTISFVDKLIQNSEKGVDLFRKHFSEEFRYIVPNTHPNKAISDKLNYVKNNLFKHH